VPPRPERPADNDYYERERVELVSQGNLFRDVPLAYPMPASELVIDEEEGDCAVSARPLASHALGPSSPAQVVQER
jgi:hypothetical protein